jgi:hypothetical protein
LQTLRQVTLSLRRQTRSKPEDEVLIVCYITLIHLHYCAYLKTKRTNLGSSGRGTTGIYTFSRWSVHRCLVCA